MHSAGLPARAAGTAFLIALLFFTPGPAHGLVVEWVGVGAARGCVEWSDACWRHYNVPYEHVRSFGSMLSLVESAPNGVIYVPGGWHPERGWPKDWRARLLQLPYLRYLGVCAGAYTFSLGSVTYYVNANRWPPVDRWTNGLTVAYGMLGPGIWAPYRTYVLGDRSGTVLYWNGPLFSPEAGPEVILVGPCRGELYSIPVPAFIRFTGDLAWTWVLDMRVRIGGVTGWGAALGVVYDVVRSPSGIRLIEHGRVVLFGPHPEFAVRTWWMLLRAYEFLTGAWTPPVFNTLKLVAELLLNYGMAEIGPGDPPHEVERGRVEEGEVVHG